MLSPKRRLLTPVAFAAALLFVASHRLPAQTPADAPPTLAVALKSLPANYPLGASLVLTVAPEDVKPLSDQEFSALLGSGSAAVPSSLGDVDPIESLGARFNRSYSIFGHVAAFGPRTMTVLGMPSDIGLNASSVPIADAVQMLMGTFTEDQWRALGAEGLSIEDLTDDQRRFWNDIVCRPLKVIPGNHPFPLDANGDVDQKAYTAVGKLIAADDVRSTTRLHAFLSATVRVSAGREMLGVAFNSDDAAPPAIHYQISMDTQPSPGPAPLDSVRSEVPNQLKPSDLDWNSDAFKATVDLHAAKTVADIVKAVGASTGLELYADRHYAARAVMFLGDSAQHVESGEIVQALDFALAGTWRKVGPAYVLTDDQRGIGERRHWIRAAVDPTNKQTNERMESVEQDLSKLPLYKYVGFLPGDTISVPADIVASLQNLDPKAEIPLGNLPLTTQQTVRRKIEEQVNDVWRADAGTYPGKMSAEAAHAAVNAINSQTPVGLRINLHLYGDLPTLGTMALDDGFSFVGYRHKSAIAASDDPISKVDLGRHPLGVIAAPGSAEEAVKLVDKMAKSGMRTLLCESFDGGETYFHSHVLPPVKSEHADVLQAAIAEGRKCNVAVYSVVHLMRWRNGIERVGDRDLRSLATEDVIVTGQTANQALDGAFRSKSDSLSRNEYVSVAGVWVSPSDPRVGDILTRLVGELASTPGLAGIALTDAAAPGYDGDVDGWYAGGIDFGYTPDLRLAYLRKQHQDPIDIDAATLAYLSIGSRTSLGTSVDLNIDTYHPGGAYEPSDDWANFRKSINNAVLKQIYDTAPAGTQFLDLHQWRDLRFAEWRGPVAKEPDGVAPAPAFVVWPYRDFETSGNPLWVDLGAKIKRMDADTENAPILFDFSLTPAVTDPVAAVGDIANLAQIAKPTPSVPLH